MSGGKHSVKPANVDLSQTAERRVFSRSRSRTGRSAFEQTAEDFSETLFPDQTRCLTPEGTVWNIARRRLIIGDEKLALQAIWAPSAKTAEFTQKLKRDLAGNSWNGIDFLVVTIAFLLSLCEAAGYQKLCAKIDGEADELQDLGILPEWFAEHMGLVKNMAPATSASSGGAASADE